MVIDSPPSVEWLLKKFLDKDYEIYIVGGAVRDLLLGKQVSDWDFATNVFPEIIVQLFEDTFYENAFGTVGVVYPEEKKRYEENIIPVLPIYEVTTFRTEHGYSDNRRPDNVEWGTTLEDDLKRRDFTINAMALKPVRENNRLNYELIDQHGGKYDLDNKVIRTVGNPADRFEEDSLRMMRAIRIGAQLGFSLEENTLNAIIKYKDLINKISMERIRDELLKIVSSYYPSQGITLLYTCGLLEYILPELIEGRDVWQGGHHKDDVWTHSLKSLDACPSNNKIVKLATLIHDIGKPRSRALICQKCKYFYKPKEDIDTVNEVEEWICERCGNLNMYKETVAFHNHEMIGEKMAEEICDRLRLSNIDREKIVKLVRWHMFSVDERQTEKAIRRFIKNVGKENLEDILDLRIGDRIGGGARETSWRLERFKKLIELVQQQPFEIRDLKIKGTDIMKLLQIPPGRRIGEILRTLFEEVEDKLIENNLDVLQKRVLELGKDIN